MIVRISQMNSHGMVNYADYGCRYDSQDNVMNMFATAADMCVEDGIDDAMLYNYSFFVDSDFCDYGGKVLNRWDAMEIIYGVEHDGVRFMSRDGEMVWHALLNHHGDIVFRGILEGYNKDRLVAFTCERFAS